MTKFFKAITLLLCFELTLAPISPNLSLLMKEARGESCPDGLQFDSILNRCLTNEQTTKVMNVAKQCGNNIQCYKQNAIEELQKAESEGKAPKRVETNQMMSTVGNVVAIAGPLAILVSGTATSTSTCASVSFYTMVAGSLAFIVGDNLANMQHADRLKKLKEKWGQIVNPEQAKGDVDKEKELSQNAQGQAFGLLAEAEDSLAKAAGMKKTFYMVAGIAYGVSAIAAGLEIVNPKAICKPKEAKADGGDNSPAKDTNASQDTNSPQNNKPADPGQNNDFFEKTKKYDTLQFTPFTPGETSIPKSGAIPRKTNLNGLFNYVVSSKPQHFLNHQFFYNLKQSQDLVSYLANTKAFELSQSSPSLDYYKDLKEAFDDFEIEKDSLEILKEFSIAAISNLNPISDATAADAQKKSAVDTNAAKAYKEEEAKGINWMALGAGAGIGLVGGFVLKKVFEKYQKSQMIMPITRAALATLMAGWSLIMSSHAKKQEEASKKRAELLRQMQKDFNVASGTLNTCKSEDRNDPSRPECYCYTAQNQRNPNRGNSQVCQKLWSGINLTPTNYLAKTPEKKICITNDRQADPTCSCRAKNTCMKVGLNGLNGLNTGSFSVLSKSLDPINKLANGSANAGSFSDSGLANMASKLKAMNAKLENNPKMGDFKNKKKKAMDQITATLTNGTAGMTNNPLLGSSGGSMPSNPGEAARMLEKELENEGPKSIGGSNDSFATPSSGGKKDEVDLNLAGGDEENKDEKLAEVMNQDLDYNKNDINNDSNSIFDILTNRYQRSGMRRLFDEEGTSKPEDPAKSDISQ